MRRRNAPPSVDAATATLAAALADVDGLARGDDPTVALRVAADAAIALCSRLVDARAATRNERPTAAQVAAARPLLVAALSTRLSSTCTAPGCGCDLPWAWATQLRMMRTVLRAFAVIDPCAVGDLPTERLEWLCRPAARRLAIALAACIGRDPACCRLMEGTLVALTASPTWQAAEEATRALGRVGADLSQAGRRALVRGLAHGRWQVRLAAVRALQRCGGGAPALAQAATKDPHPSVQFAAGKPRAQGHATETGPVAQPPIGSTRSR